jgi:hypothetical protein
MPAPVELFFVDWISEALTRNFGWIYPSRKAENLLEYLKNRVSFLVVLL